MNFNLHCGTFLSARFPADYTNTQCVVKAILMGIVANCFYCIYTLVALWNNPMSALTCLQNHSDSQVLQILHSTFVFSHPNAAFFLQSLILIFTHCTHSHSLPPPSCWTHSPVYECTVHSCCSLVVFPRQISCTIAACNWSYKNKNGSRTEASSHCSLKRASSLNWRVCEWQTNMMNKAD